MGCLLNKILQSSIYEIRCICFILDEFTKVESKVVRYYHVFETGELEELIGHVPCLKLLECIYEQGNWSAIVRKIDADR